MTRAIIVIVRRTAAARNWLTADSMSRCLESHIYAGGCAGTFITKNTAWCRSHTGRRIQGKWTDGHHRKSFDIDWQGKVDDIGIKVYWKDILASHAWLMKRPGKERFEQFGRSGEKFWKWQENTADLLWDLLRYPPWPPKNLRISRICEYNPRPLAFPENMGISESFFILATPWGHWDTSLKGSEKMRRFIDAQLLIAAQTTSVHATPYSAAALILSRQGVIHPEGGMEEFAIRWLKNCEKKAKVLFKRNQ